MEPGEGVMVDIVEDREIEKLKILTISLSSPLWCCAFVDEFTVVLAVLHPVHTTDILFVTNYTVV